MTYTLTKEQRNDRDVIANHVCPATADNTTFNVCPGHVLQVTVDNVEQLLPAADQFHVIGLVKACCDFLQRELTPANCIGIRRLDCWSYVGMQRLDHELVLLGCLQTIF